MTISIASTLSRWFGKTPPPVAAPTSAPLPALDPSLPVPVALAKLSEALRTTDATQTLAAGRAMQALLRAGTAKATTAEQALAWGNLGLALERNGVAEGEAPAELKAAVQRFNTEGAAALEQSMDDAPFEAARGIERSVKLLADASASGLPVRLLKSFGRFAGEAALKQELANLTVRLLDRSSPSFEANALQVRTLLTTYGGHLNAYDRALDFGRLGGQLEGAKLAPLTADQERAARDFTERAAPVLAAIASKDAARSDAALDAGLALLDGPLAKSAPLGAQLRLMQLVGRAAHARLDRL